MAYSLQAGALEGVDPELMQGWQAVLQGLGQNLAGHGAPGEEGAGEEEEGMGGGGGEDEEGEEGDEDGEDDMELGVTSYIQSLWNLQV